MYLYLIIMAACGILFILLGWRIWKKEQITLIHDYHYTKVTEADQKSYTTIMGLAMIVMGAGMLISGIIDFFTNVSYSTAVFGVTFVAGLIMMLVAQIKYNHGIF